MRFYHVSPLRASLLVASNSANQLIACVMVPRILSHGPSEDAIACYGCSFQISVQVLDKFIAVCSAPFRGVCIFGATIRDEYAGLWGPQLAISSQSQSSSPLLNRRRLCFGSRCAPRATMQVLEERREAATARGVVQSDHELVHID